MSIHITHDGWQFSVDYKKTLRYSQCELTDNCQCDLCRHFYDNINRYYPHLRSFLESYGVEIFAPESLIAYASYNDVECSLAYKVYGEILSFGSTTLLIDDAQITAEYMDDETFYITLSVTLPPIPQK